MRSVKNFKMHFSYFCNIGTMTFSGTTYARSKAPTDEIVLHFYLLTATPAGPSRPFKNL